MALIESVVFGGLSGPSETPICNRCGQCCYFREDGGPVTKCRHLGEDNLCMQYDSRPDMCKNWWCLKALGFKPGIENNLKTPQYNKGRHFNENDVFKKGDR